MKRKLTIISLLLLTYLSVFSQSIKKIEKTLKKIDSIEQAKKLRTKNLQWDIWIFSSSSSNNDLPESLSSLEKGKTKTIEKIDGTYVYKVIGEEMETKYRAGYIYFDGNKLSIKTIDSLRNVILLKYKSGINFSFLVDEYSMFIDLETINNDLGWFGAGEMHKDFVEAVSNHTKGDIFSISIVERNSHYVTLITHDTTVFRKIMLIKIKAAANSK